MTRPHSPASRNSPEARSRPRSVSSPGTARTKGWPVRILLNGLSFWGYHGILPPERRHGGPFRVDLDLRIRMVNPARDRLADTLDYRAVYAIAKKSMERRRFRTLEALAFSLAKSIVRMHRVVKVKARVTKLAPPFGGGATSAAEVKAVRDS